MPEPIFFHAAESTPENAAALYMGSPLGPVPLGSLASKEVFRPNESQLSTITGANFEIVLAPIILFGAFSMKILTSAPNEREYPEHMYVAAPSVAKLGAIFVAALCVFSLVMSFSTGFSLIDPYACLIFLVGAITFYTMGAMAERRSKSDRKIN